MGITIITLFLITTFPTLMAVTPEPIFSTGNRSLSDKAVSVLFNEPPNPPIIEGPITGDVRTYYLYNITVTDPLDEPLLRLEVDFGDGSEILQECGCNGPWPSGEVIPVEHRWTQQGSYLVKARVEDGLGLWSDWGNLEISMARTSPVFLWGIMEQLSVLFSTVFSISLPFSS